MIRPRHRGGVGDVLDFAAGIGADPWRFVGFHPGQLGIRRRRPFAGRPFARRRAPSVVTLLLAGLAVFALVKLMSATTGRRRSTAERVVLGGLLLLAGAVVMAFRRSSRRYRW